MITRYFSQHGQDKFLDEYIFKGKTDGFFVDVGAYDGETNSNTLMLEETRNWTGINIEPLPKPFQKLSKRRPNCINIQCAVSDSCGVEQFMLNEGYTEQLSGLIKTYDAPHFLRLKRELDSYGGTTQTIDVPVLTLEAILKNIARPVVDLLCIDIEGGELAALKGINWGSIPRIDVIMFEDNNYGHLDETVNFLVEKGYKRYIDNNVWKIADVIVYLPSAFETVFNATKYA